MTHLHGYLTPRKQRREVKEPVVFLPQTLNSNLEHDAQLINKFKTSFEVV